MKRKGLLIFAAAAALAVGGTMAAEAAGWAAESNGWVYYDSNGYKVTNDWKKGADGLWRYLDYSGRMAVNTWVDDTYYVDQDGIMVTGKWMRLDQDIYGGTEEPQWYYFGSDGEAEKDGWKKLNDKWYYFDETGAMGTGWLDDNMYYGTENGAVTGWRKLEPPEGEEYYDDDPFSEDDGKRWYYFNSSGKKYVPEEEFGEKRIDGVYYCFDSNGAMQTGWVNVGDADSDSHPIEDYRFYDQNGKAVTGWYSAEPPEGMSGYEEEVEWFYFSRDGKPVAGPEAGQATSDDFRRINNKTYLFNSLGNPVSGLQKIYTSSSMEDYTAYYFDENTRTVCKGKMTIEEGDGSTAAYYFAESGKGYTGVHSGYLYNKGKLQKAEPGLRFQPITVETSSGAKTYLVNEAGRVTKSSSGIKDGDGIRYYTNNAGILTAIETDGDKTAVGAGEGGRPADVPIFED